MSIATRSEKLLLPWSLERPVTTALTLCLVLFAVSAADVLFVRLDGVPAFLPSRIVGVIVLVGALWLLGASLRSVGLHRNHLGPAALAGGLVLASLYLLLYGVQFVRLAAAGEAPSLAFGVLDADGAGRGLLFTLVFLLVTALNSFLEEGLFRGLMLPRFLRRVPFWQANALQAALFGFWHLPIAGAGWLRGEASGAEAVAQGAELFVATATAGLVFGFLYQRTGSLWAPWLAHTIDNLVLNVVHLRAAGGIDAQAEIAVVASLAGYPLLVLAAWAVARRFRLPPLPAWPRSGAAPDTRG